MKPTTIPLNITTAAAILALLAAGCDERKSETPTSGHANIAVCDEILPLMRDEEARFEELYPEAKIDLRPMAAREAVSELFNDSVKVIVSSRALNAEEEAARKALNLGITEFRLAMDAITVIVNPANDVTKLNLPQLDSVFSGSIMDWALLGWKAAPGKITLCVPDRNMSSFQGFSERVLKGGGFARSSTVLRSSEDMVAAVEKDPTAIGILGLNWKREAGSRVRTIDLADPAAPDSLGGGKYYAPHQAYVYKGFYPLVRIVYIYITPDSYGVTSGFTSFLTSAAGQKIIQNQGLVPATMPVRLVELRNDAL